MPAWPYEPLGVRYPPGDLAALRVLVEIIAPRTPVWRNWRIADVGAGTGEASVHLASAGWQHSKRKLFRAGHVWAIDLWDKPPNDAGPDYRATPAQLEAAFYANVGKRAFCEIQPTKADALWLAGIWPTRNKLDFVWLNDADTSYERTKALILAWQPLVTKTGILCGHDYGVSDGVSKAVDELLPRAAMSGQTLWWQQMDTRKK